MALKPEVYDQVREWAVKSLGIGGAEQLQKALNSLNPEDNEKLENFVNENPDAAIASARKAIDARGEEGSKWNKSPELMKEIATNPKEILGLLGVNAAQIAPAETAPESKAEPQEPSPESQQGNPPAEIIPESKAKPQEPSPGAQKNNPPATEEKPAASPPPSSDLSDRLAALLETDEGQKLAKNIQESPELRAALQEATGLDINDTEKLAEQLGSSDGMSKEQMAKLENLVSTLEKNTDKFDDINQLIEKHPQMVANNAEMFINDPEAALKHMESMQSIEGMKTSLLNGIDSFSPGLASILGKVFDFIMPMLGPIMGLMGSLNSLKGSDSKPMHGASNTNMDMVNNLVKEGHVVKINKDGSLIARQDQKPEQANNMQKPEQQAQNHDNTPAPVSPG